MNFKKYVFKRVYSIIWRNTYGKRESERESEGAEARRERGRQREVAAAVVCKAERGWRTEF